MTQPQSMSGAIISSLLIGAIVFAPNVVWAQGFEFGEEEVEEVTEAPPQEGDGNDGGAMTFSSEDLSKEDSTEEKTQFQTAIVSIPSADNDPERSREIQNRMMELAKDVPTIIAMGPETVLPGIQQRDVTTCVTDPLCLGSVGDEGKVERILIARVKQSPDGNGLQLDLDYFDVKDRLFIKYHSKNGLGSTGSITDALVPAFKDVFEIRDTGPGTQFVGDEDSGIVQDIVAWGAGGLAVAFLGAGIYFGLDASSQEDDIEGKKVNGVYTISQNEAQSMQRDAEGSATTANIFYGLAAAMAVTSAVFFIIKGGSDVAKDQERSDLIKDLRFGPVFNEAGAGVGAGFRF